MRGDRAMKFFCACVVFSLLHVRGGQAQNLIPRIERPTTYAVTVTNPVPGSTFYAPVGRSIRFYCFCQAYAMVQLLHGETIVHPWQSCSTVLHTVHNVSYSDEGKYTCRVQDATNHICDRPLGNLSVISPDVVIAEPRQYGVINTRASLSCITTLDDFANLIIYKWFRSSGETRVLRAERSELEFESTNRAHEGLYTCQVYISSMDIRIEKTVEFQVIEPPLTTETPPTSETPPTFITPPRVNGINQIEPTPSGITDILKPLPAFWLLFIVAVLLGTQRAII